MGPPTVIFKHRSLPAKKKITVYFLSILRIFYFLLIYSKHNVLDRERVRDALCPERERERESERERKRF